MTRYLPVAALAVVFVFAACNGGDGSQSQEPSAEANGSPSAEGTSLAEDSSPVPGSTPAAGSTQEPSVQITVHPPPTTLSIQSVTSPVGRGEEATVVAQSDPDTSCTIAVIRSNFQGLDYIGVAPTFEVMQQDGLQPSESDESGQVTWTWQIAADAAPEEWRVEVVCGLGETAEDNAPLVVVEGP